MSKIFVVIKQKLSNWKLAILEGRKSIIFFDSFYVNEFQSNFN